MVEVHYQPSQAVTGSLLFKQVSLAGLWEPALGLAAVLTEWGIKLSSACLHQELAEGRIVGYFQKPSNEKPLDHSFSAMLPIRGLLPGNRSLENGSLDFFIVPHLGPERWISKGLAREDKKLSVRLEEKMPPIQGALRHLARIIEGNEELGLFCTRPFWEQDCVPMWQVSGYWIRGIIV